METTDAEILYQLDLVFTSFPNEYWWLFTLKHFSKFDQKICHFSGKPIGYACSKDHSFNSVWNFFFMQFHFETTHDDESILECLNLEISQCSSHSRKCVVSINLQIMPYQFNRVVISHKWLSSYKTINFSLLSKSFACLPLWICLIAINGVNVKHFARLNCSYWIWNLCSI